MSEYLKMSKKSVFLKDIKNYLKKLECGQLEIEAGQWELHKDILNMRNIFDEFKNFKKDLEDVKKSNLEQMGIIRKLELSLKQQPDDVCPKESNDSNNKTDDICQAIDKRMTKDSNKEPKKKTHIVQSEEIIEITSHLESNGTKSVSDCKSEGGEDRKGKKHVRSPIRSIVYFRKHGTGPGTASNRCRFPSKKKDNAMLQRYLNDSAKYCDEKVSNPVIEASRSAEICKTNNKEDGPSKSDSWNSCNNKPKNPNSCDRNDEGNFLPLDRESVMPKTAPYDKKRKSFMMSSYFNEKSKRKKKEYACGVCKKGFHAKDLIRARDVVYKKKSENSLSYKCDYCNNVYKTPEILEKHKRKCQLIRSIFRKS